MNGHRLVMGLVSVVLVTSLSTAAHAGLMDTFNRAVSSAENAKNTATRAGNLIPKSNKPKAAPAEKKAEVQPVGTMTAKDKAAIEKAKRSWVAAFKSEDWDALVDSYAEDAVLLAPDENAVTGHEAIRAYYGTDEDTSDEVFQTVSMGGDSNIVYVQGEFSFTIQAKDEEPVQASGKYMEIWQKQEDGNWLITHDIFNANPLVTN